MSDLPEVWCCFSLVSGIVLWILRVKKNTESQENILLRIPVLSSYAEALKNDQNDFLARW